MTAEKLRFEEGSPMMHGMARNSQTTDSVSARTRAKRSRQAGFTLAELLAVVAMVGILATIAMFSFRSYLRSSKVSEATAMVGHIRAAQESFRSETMTYLDVSTDATSWYPAGPNSRKRAWEFEHVDGVRWKQLGVRSDSPVYFGYVTKAGLAGTTPMQPQNTIANIEFMPSGEVPREPWYVIHAAGDLNEDGVFCNVIGSSFTGEIYVENEGE